MLSYLVRLLTTPGGRGRVLKKITKAVVMAALALALPLAAQAAGLGKLTLISALGQPLNAEIEIVSLQAGEEDLTARLATSQAFAQAGIEPSPILADVRFTIERRGSTPVLRMRSTQPVNEPFLELLVELSWPTGRLVREYTFLLDPPEYKSKQMAIAAAQAQQPKPAAQEPKLEATPPAQVAPQPPAETKPEAQPVEPSPPVAAAPAAPTTAEPPPPTAPTPPPAAATEPQTPATPPSAAPSSPAPEQPRAGMPKEPVVHEVKPGDTLGKIARANLPPGVTLNQMLIALYRANEGAFIRQNVNLVRAGRILNIPDADVVGTIDRAEADRLMKEQYAQFNEYRSRLAAAPTSAETAPGQQGAAGRIEAKPPAAPTTSAQDQLRLSKVEPAKPGAASQAARDDDVAARQRALNEAQSRQSDLEKNVGDLRKLLELKNQQLAELEKKATAKPAATPPAPTPPAPVAQAPATPAPATPAKPPVEAAKPAPAPAQPAPAPAKPPVEAAKPTPPPAPTAGATPATPAPSPAKPPAAPAKPEAKKAAPAPAPETGLLDEFVDNPLYLGLGVALLFLLGGYGYIQWRRKKAAHAKFQDSVLGAAAAGAAGTTAPLGTPTAGGGVSPAAGAPAAAAASPTTETEEVDPIAEADVYMAYGRDAQAEEILKEALAKDSKRVPVLAKLLEIYAHRKDAKTFEQTAMKLKQVTDSKGPEWDKAAALGRSIDPQNSIYGGGDAPAAAVAAAAAPAAAAPTLDFDLGGGGAAAQGPASAPDISLDAPAKEASAPALDFDLGGAPAAPAQPSHDTTQVLQKEDPGAGLDFNLDLGTPAAPAAPAAEEPKSAPADEGLNFDINLDLGGTPAAAPTAEEKSAPAMDLSAISLDLGTPGEAPAAPAGGGSDPKWQEVATKLDLAKAYEEMGDKDGARELLNEVMKDGDAAQKGTAQQLLAKLG
jgi:pilus assembly protein FimV